MSLPCAWKKVQKFCRAQHLEIPALYDAPSITSLGLPAWSQPFPPVGLPSHVLNLCSYLELTSTSAFLKKLFGNNSFFQIIISYFCCYFNSSPFRLFQSVWKDWLVPCDSLLLFLCISSLAWACVGHYLAQRQGQNGKGLGSGSKLGAEWDCTWHRNNILFWSSLFLTSGSLWGKERGRNACSLWGWHIFSPFSLNFLRTKQAQQKEHLSSKQTVNVKNALLTKMVEWWFHQEMKLEVMEPPSLFNKENYLNNSFCPSLYL